jgi:hypothetical protein
MATGDREVAAPSTILLRSTIGDTIIQSKSSHSMMLAYSINKPGDTKGEVVQVPKPAPEGPGFALIRVLVRANALRVVVCGFVYELH